MTSPAATASAPAPGSPRGFAACLPALGLVGLVCLAALAFFLVVYDTLVFRPDLAPRLRLFLGLGFCVITLISLLTWLPGARGEFTAYLYLSRNVAARP